MRKLLFTGAITICVAVAVLILRLPSNPAPGLPSEPESVRGLVTQVTASGTPLGFIAVDQSRTGSTSAVVRVAPDTRILLKDGSRVTAGRFSDLHVGQLVLVWFTGPVAQSYPVQATAGVIAIVVR